MNQSVSWGVFSQGCVFLLLQFSDFPTGSEVKLLQIKGLNVGFLELQITALWSFKSQPFEKNPTGPPEV